MKSSNVDLKTMFPRASQSFIEANASDAVQPIMERKKGKHEANHQRKIQDSEPEHHQTPALDSANEGKTKRMGRTIVSFTGFRVRPLDPDNFAASCKDLLDGIVHAGLVFDDTPWLIILRTEQEKVKSYAQEKTVIEIEFPVHATETGAHRNLRG